MSAYEIWVSQKLKDKDLTEELLSIKGNEEEINDRFYRNLEFGTGGLRGIIGAGTNRMNVYTVAKATQGMANYLLNHADGKPQSVAIAHDSRIKGVDFAHEAASVLAANGIKAYVYPQLMPTPALSFAVRYLKSDAGINITASHNPSKYNGYKAYGSDGCQVTADMAEEITDEMESLDIFADIKTVDFEEGIKSGLIEYISDEVVDAFIEAVYGESLKGDCGNIKVVYTPLNGSGKMCVTRILDKIGVSEVTIVPEQSEPDGNFPTCPYPNPEFREALEKGIELSQKVKPDLLLATDPDCDRVGIAVNQNGEYVLVSGNEVGILMLDFIAKIRTERNTMPENPVVVTTIVSTDMVDVIAKDFDIEIKRCLTGFKYIGDIIAELEEQGREDAYLLGFEESYGYLTGGYVRDKDAVNGSMIICEMASFYKEKGMTLVDAMASLYEKYGYYINETCNFTFEGENGMKAMSKIMDDLRRNPPKDIAGMKVSTINDYGTSVSYTDGAESPISLPVSNVLEYKLDGGCKFTVRPSGTEPKIKMYLSGTGSTREAANEAIEKMTKVANEIAGV